MSTSLTSHVHIFLSILYQSSLTGQGTNVKVGFAKEMLAAAKSFEKNQKLLVKSIDKKDTAKTSEALEGLSEAMLAYVSRELSLLFLVHIDVHKLHSSLPLQRTSGRLLGPDGGGDIPSVDEIRRSTKRFRGEAFEAKVKERDARVKAAAEAAAKGN